MEQRAAAGRGLTHVLLLELTRQVTLHERGLADTTVADKHHLEHGPSELSSISLRHVRHSVTRVQASGSCLSDASERAPGTPGSGVDFLARGIARGWLRGEEGAGEGAHHGGRKCVRGRGAGGGWSIASGRAAFSSAGLTVFENHLVC